MGLASILDRVLVCQEPPRTVGQPYSPPGGQVQCSGSFRQDRQARSTQATSWARLSPASSILASSRTAAASSSRYTAAGPRNLEPSSGAWSQSQSSSWSDRTSKPKFRPEPPIL